MKRILYNIASTILIIFCIAFAFYCIKDYQTYEMVESLIYTAMAFASAIIIALNFIPKKKPSRN